MSSSWYGNKQTVNAKQLDILIEKKLKLSELLLYPEFITEIKAYNTKLLDYLTNNPYLMSQLVDFIAVPPSITDSDQRKYKLPLMAIQVIESETTCIHNSLFKQSGKDQTYFQGLFKLLDNTQMLPILAGYLFRANICLLNNRQKQTIDRIYCMPRIFNKLIQHSYHMSIANIIQLFINLDTNKHQNHNENDSRMKIKLQALQLIINKIQIQSGLRNQKSAMIIENLCGILCETIQKYFLIINGKQMMEIITSQKTISLFMSMIKMPANPDNAFPAFNFFISLINYYSFSSFNVDDLSNQDGKANLQRLQSQPMIIQLSAYFAIGLDKIMNANVLNLHLYRLLEVLCHCISISSLKILQCARKTQFFNNLVKLMFVHQRHNILHVLIQKSFLHIFISDRKIYQQYKKHLFCEIDIIDATAGHFVRQLSLDKLFEEGRKKPYFGHFMRILKIYSGIQTQDQGIIRAIKSKSQLWNKISKHLIIPFENIYEKKLGTYEQVPEPAYQEFKVDKNVKIKSNPMKNSTIQQINKEENVPTGIKSEIQTNAYTKMQQLQEKKAQEMFFKAPIQGFLSHNQITNTSQPSKPAAHSSHYMSQSNVVDYEVNNPKELKKSESFKQFMDKKKVQAQQQIKTKRSLSHQKRLSGNKTKISNPSPSKKNKWKQDSQETPSKSTVDTTRQTQQLIPKIPLSRKNLTGAQASNSDRLHLSQAHPSIPTNINSIPSVSINPRSILSVSSAVTNNMSMSISRQQGQNSQSQSQSQSQIDIPADIKKIRIIQIDKPLQKKYRRVQKKDELLFNFLGLTF